MKEFICEKCGHKNEVKPALHFWNLNVGKVRALKALVDYYQLNKKPMALKEIALTNPQYTNFCHLQYWELAKHVTGGWIPTELGLHFVHGHVRIPKTVATLGTKQILSYQHQAWETRENPEPVYIYEIDETAYKQKEEYQADNQLKLV